MNNNNNEIYKSAVEEIKRRRNNAIQQAECYKYNILKDNEYLQIANEIGCLILDIAKANFKNESTTDLQNRLKIAQKQEDKVLSQHHLKREDLIPNYTCKLCNDTGVCNDKRCRCLESLIASKISTEDFTITYSDLKLIDKKYITLLQKIAEQYNKNKKIINIVISGSVGVGKTQLTKALYNDLKSKNNYCIFTTATRINQALLCYHTCFDEDKNNHINCYIDCDALFIDDLGIEPMLNNVTKEYLLMLISERIMLNKMTVISTNLTVKEMLDRYGERIISRLFDKSNSIALDIQGKDLRLNKGE
ncbi:MAG: ATP-binding protein [Clostridia bacterium]|nr:ATP-binding protein [Clostridia bacterium]